LNRQQKWRDKKEKHTGKSRKLKQKHQQKLVFLTMNYFTTRNPGRLAAGAEGEIGSGVDGVGGSGG